MARLVDISCDGKLEDDGTYTVTLTMRGFVKEAHAVRAGNYLQKPAQEAIAYAGHGELVQVRGLDLN